MAEQKHTAGKIKVIKPGYVGGNKSTTRCLQIGKDSMYTTSELLAPDAHRLADCWNALAGISDPSAVGELVVEFEAMFEALQKVIPNARLTEPGKRAISLLSRLKGTT